MRIYSQLLEETMDKGWWHPLAGTLVSTLVIGLGALVVLAQ